ncbi:hypothetical protein PAUR_b0092 [Pseudoalteromonas aurantia 208]|uniref:Uncharacterized protein n=1 Tax=Pseudoalteromonas aurantia 208 TaxID=1314867 RepID=A0ABR9EGL0_9GAMM|nr:hypothetical protein [Pseudoalteromonas aurantia 208]
MKSGIKNKTHKTDEVKILIKRDAFMHRVPILNLNSLTLAKVLDDNKKS